MKTRKQQLEAALLCDALGAEDGIDPRGRKKTSRQSNRTYHQEKLASQAERALSLALSSSVDPILQDLVIIAVSAVGNSLQVVVAPLANGNFPSVSEVEKALHRASGRLRALVGEAITRKRVPELIFSVHHLSEVSHG